MTTMVLLEGVAVSAVIKPPSSARIAASISVDSDTVIVGILGIVLRSKET